MTTVEEIRDDFAEFAAWLKAERVPTPKNVYLYALLDADDNLLYVGQSCDVERRVRQHRRSQPWAEFIARHVVVAGPMERIEAQVRERLLINESQPIYNLYCTGREFPPRGRHSEKALAKVAAATRRHEFTEEELAEIRAAGPMATTGRRRSA